jgi:putative ABC transport system substrate-binding protein
MRRRELITLLGGASLAWPLAARAQQLRRIGVLTLFSEHDTEGRFRFSAFQEGLREAGWVEGRNFRIDYRWADGDLDRLRAYAAEMVGSAPEAIFCNSTPVLAALRKETQTIPIVFTGISDPIGAGFVASLARPAGNLTGFASFEPEMGGKWLQELNGVAPNVNRVAFILNRQNASWANLFRAIEVVASTLGVNASAVDVRDAAEIELAIKAFGSQSNGGLIVPPTLLTRADEVIE